MKIFTEYARLIVIAILLSGCSTIFKSKPKEYFETRTIHDDQKSCYVAILSALEKNEYVIRNASLESGIIDGMKRTEPTTDIKNYTDISDIIYGITIFLTAESDSTTTVRVSLQKGAFNRHRHLLGVEHLRDPIQFDPFFKSVTDQLEMLSEGSE